MEWELRGDLLVVFDSLKFRCDIVNIYRQLEAKDEITGSISSENSYSI